MDLDRTNRLFYKNVIINEKRKKDYQELDSLIHSNVSIRSTPYCISQKNVVPLHGGIIFPNFETRIRSLALHQHKLMEVIP